MVLKDLLAYKMHKTANTCIVDRQAISLFNNATNGIVVGLYSKAVIKYTSLLRAQSANDLNRLFGMTLNYRNVHLLLSVRLRTIRMTTMKT